MAVLPLPLKAAVTEMALAKGFSRGRRHYRRPIGDGGLTLQWNEFETYDGRYRESEWTLQVWPACALELWSRLGWRQESFAAVDAASGSLAWFAAPSRVPPGRPPYDRVGYYPDDPKDLADFAGSLASWFARAVEQGLRWLEQPLVMADAIARTSDGRLDGIDYRLGPVNNRSTVVALLAAQGGDLARARRALAEIQSWADEQPDNDLPVDIMAALCEIYPGLG